MSSSRTLLYQVAKRLRTVALEIVETAIGSSRIAMYRSIADVLREQADTLEEIAQKEAP